MQTRFLFTASLTAATIAAISSSMPAREPGRTLRPRAPDTAVVGAPSTVRNTTVSRRASNPALATRASSRGASERVGSHISRYLPPCQTGQKCAPRSGMLAAVR
uniref:Secreted protein n=1 Tax=uncultured Armatimonadetes bacterium TaxID=157466 RepID=A0A6J4IHT2_9BACT|nr:hypothetical protein AVDCRST_MAG63-1917 [uncultured Armatimonadetes bacterium]